MPEHKRVNGFVYIKNAHVSCIGSVLNTLACVGKKWFCSYVRWYIDERLVGISFRQVYKRDIMYKVIWKLRETIQVLEIDPVFMFIMFAKC